LKQILLEQGAENTPVKAGVAMLSQDQRKVIVRPWLESLA